VLYRNFVDTDLNRKFRHVILPQNLRDELVRLAHEGITGGHLGLSKIQDQVQWRAYWCGWREQVRRVWGGANLVAITIEDYRHDRAYYNQWLSGHQWSGYMLI
jgi:hypothetical protein